jgi:alkylation response protein AidB-like acyl-CoA dehydrogenase
MSTMTKEHTATSSSGHDILGKAGDAKAFRAAARAWLEETVEAEKRTFPAAPANDFYERQQWWMAERNKVGMATPHWPSEYGGADLSLSNQVIVAEEMARAGAPAMSLFTVSLNHIPHTLIRWGTPQQKARHLPGVAKGVVWCQGFSEPNAGSDLAALRTRAVLDGDHYVINGQKIWSSFSMYAKHCILLVRTDLQASKHTGISFLLMDMDTPGVDVRPLRQVNGTAKFAEIFLTDVRIPVENLVGPENGGWAVAQTTLSAERGVLSFESGERLRYQMEQFYADAIRADRSWLKDREMTREFARLFGEMQGCRRLLRRLLRENEAKGSADLETVVCVKVINSALRRKVGDFMVRAGGLAEQFHPEDADQRLDLPLNAYISSFGGTIAAGSNEIMRNVLAERILGMPKS